MSKTVAIVGATGAVGRTLLAILHERSFPVGALRLMASARSAGTRTTTQWGEVEVEDLASADPTGVDVALFSAGGQRSLDHAPRFAEAGAVVVDNSSAFRMHDDVPLVTAGVNDDDAVGHRGIIANPNCTTMVLMMAVAPLHRAAGVRSIVATSYQAVSGSGQGGVEELSDQVDELGQDRRSLMVGGWRPPTQELYVRPIGWNVLPFAGTEADEGYTDEEWKLVRESRKILSTPELDVQPTCVRVPVMVGHGIAASVRFDRPIDVPEASALLEEFPGVQLWRDTVPTPLDSAGLDDVLVGRLRQAVGDNRALNLWVVGDNLRKGAALNAVQIAERLVSD